MRIGRGDPRGYARRKGLPRMASRGRRRSVSSGYMLAWASGAFRRKPLEAGRIRAWAEWAILCVLIVAVVLTAIDYIRLKAAITRWRYEAAKLQVQHDELVQTNRKLIIEQKTLCGLSDLERIAKRSGLREPTDTPMLRIRMDTRR